jgi:hypothetical protein
MVFFQKNKDSGKKILFREKFTHEEQLKYEKQVQEMYELIASRRGTTTEKLLETVKVGEKRKRKERYPKPFHLRYEWENNRLFLVFQKVATDGNGKVIWA